MKRCLLFAAILTFYGLTSQLLAQNFSGGLQVGGNVSQVDGDEQAGFNQAGLSLGGFLVYELSDHFAFQPEILFEQLGSRRQGLLILRTNHISLPLLLRYQITLDLADQQQVLDIHAGPVLGYLFSASSDFGQDVTPQLNRYDVRVVAGLEYRFSASLSVMMRYGYSLLPFYRPGGGGNVFNAAPTGLWHQFITFGLRGWLIGT